MNNFTDLHCHIVYGLDDGAQNFEESIQMIRRARADGISRIVATTHVYAGIEKFNYSLYLVRLGEIQKWCQDNEPSIQVFPGGEVFYTEAAVRLLESRKIPTLANSSFVLVEFDVTISFEKIFQAIRGLQKAGFLPILAHIERYECLVYRPELLHELRQTINVRFQVNGRTVIKTPFQLRKFLRFLFEESVIDYVATDSHSTGSRPVCMAQAYKIILNRYGLETANDLCGLRQDEIFQYSMSGLQ